MSSVPFPNFVIEDDEDEVLRVQMTGQGPQTISLHQQRFQEGTDAMTTFNIRGPGAAASSLRRPRPLPPVDPLALNSSSQPLNPLQDTQSASCNALPLNSESPFLRRLDSFRRSSTEFSLASFRQTRVSMANTTPGTNGNGGSGTIPAEFDPTTAGGPGPGVADFPADLGVGVQASVSSESQALYRNEDLVTEMRPEYARWFYRYEIDRTWTQFTGYDSIRMEHRYRNLVLEREAQEGFYFNTGYQNHNQQCNDEAVWHNENDIADPNVILTTSTTYNITRSHEGQHSSHQHLCNNNGFENTYNVCISDCVEALSSTNITFNEHSNQQHEHPTGNDGSASMFNHSLQSHPPRINPHDEPIYENIPHPSRFGTAGERQSKSCPEDSPGEENCGGNIIIVRGGLYEADLESWSCTATYWPGDKCQITRGTWFYDGTWQPLSIEHAERLEEEHLTQFCGVSLSLFAQTNGGTSSQPESPTRKNRPIVHRVSFCEFHVDWSSPTEIHLYSKAASYKFMRSVGIRLGFQTWGHRLCRGYFKPASKEDRPSEISHLVFVIHGIGQKMDTGRIVRNCSQFRECVSSLKEKFFPHLTETKQRAEFFPVEWRSAAKLDGDVVDAITPHKLLSLRQLLNATAMDIMYYTSPLYRAEIQNALRNELNRIYSNFVKRNPNFVGNGGKVSVIAHSLGAVITYDIITGYIPQTPDGAVGVDSQGFSSDLGAPLQKEGLLFQLEHFFCLGSPLPVFLALRWREPHNATYRSYILPSRLCKRIYNIFYSTDPVAYRLEPLLNKYYVHIAPIPIHTYGSVVSRPKYDEMPREKINKEISLPRQEVQVQNGYNSNTQSANSTPQRGTNNLRSPSTPTKESNWGWTALMKYLKSGDPGPLCEGDIGSELASPTDGNSSPPSRDEGNSTPEDVTSDIPNDLPFRMDFVLKESNFSSTYLAALTSHTSYWTSPDTAFFVLTHLYGDMLDLPQGSALN